MFSEYRDFIKKSMKTGELSGFINPDPEHTSTLLEQFINNADKEIIIFNKHLSSKSFAYDNVLYAIRQALCKGVKFRMAIQTDHIDNNNKNLYNIFNNYKDQVEFYTEKGMNINKHFIIIDRKTFRIEQSGDSREAFVCFNDKESSEKLAHLFEKIINTK